ncbi:hypothetical protein LAZ67_6000707 [Cordylochernes scorpioides]|uniref:Uncharacterized protein n=1 Tax=Cordylochernes scorpioides TaxID=51811 RepID=A0ABY6KLZ4_9ARAC|nr:hypothetical protein LAZ67_6000707 [Cordylochernes scorpioides]
MEKPLAQLAVVRGTKVGPVQSQDLGHVSPEVGDVHDQVISKLGQLVVSSQELLQSYVRQRSQQTPNLPPDALVSFEDHVQTQGTLLLQLLLEAGILSPVSLFLESEDEGFSSRLTFSAQSSISYFVGIRIRTGQFLKASGIWRMFEVSLNLQNSSLEYWMMLELEALILS